MATFTLKEIFLVLISVRRRDDPDSEHSQKDEVNEKFQ
jgi:hypothetical protein